ncbi:MULTISPECIES: DUF1120 domain-containing protein [unclassified Pseudomonas]|uniref:DUF1120 domain-containing protein n=1 Tax=unclassified Pseudomonas TaxID=196821 RepID=UPI0015AD9B52|nr:MULTISPECIES: DUF1120 domain-containing protein [unclassified Pseudomonas]
MKISPSLTLAAVFFAPFSVISQAAQIVDLTLIGQLVPVACDINLVGGAEVNYNVIPMSSLSSTKATPITPNMGGSDPIKTMTVICDAPAQFAVKLLDNRASSVNPLVLTGGLPAGTSADQLFGLGQDSTSTNIGAYIVTARSADLSVDGAAGKMIVSSDAGTSWVDSTAGQLLNTSAWRMSWTPAGAPSAPAPVATVSQGLGISAGIIPTATLNTGNAIPLNGLLTLEVIYL